MSQTRERRIINGLLIICIVAGFACFALICLPDQLVKVGIAASQFGSAKGPSNISEVVPLRKDERSKSAVTAEKAVVRFVPEALPKDPFQAVQPPASNTSDENAYAGAGAAIDDMSFEARQHLDIPLQQNQNLARAEAEEEESESDLSVGDPHASENPYGDEDYGDDTGSFTNIPQKPSSQNYRMSSLMRGDPATIDSEAGKRKKPWLLAPEGFEADVAFWRDIYAKYDKNYVVLHHPRYLNIVYDVVDLSDIYKDPRYNDVEREHLIENRVEARRDEIENDLMVLATNPPSSSLNHEQWRIKKLFEGVREENSFLSAYKEDGVRAQIGQRDKFIQGLARSGRFLGEIEAIFESYGVPKEITRLIFVESMFNLQAKSSAGASGIWQFMPETGRLYLNINKIVDERNDPIKSTHAAARLLLRNYEELSTWPLAINAYNAGRGRLMQAVAALGTRDLGKIMRNFSHSTYGFASRNFFLEFLAAYEVAEHSERYFGRIEHDKPLKFEIVQSNYHISLPEVARIAGIPQEVIAELNPAFTDLIMSGTRLLPKGTNVSVPEKRGDVFLASAARAPSSRTGPMHHVVSSGETLSSIASTYGVTPAAIMKRNNIAGRQLRNGQKLIIP